MNYQDLNDQLTGRNAERRKLANNTYAERRGDGAIAIRLHSTDILTYHDDGSVVFNSGGWQTVTTKQRMNEFGPQGWRVNSERGIWYADYSVPHTSPLDGDWNNRLTVSLPFNDGFTVRGAEYAMPDDALEASDVESLRQQTADYAAQYVKELRRGNMGKPGMGDCFYCRLRTVGEKKPLGDAIHDQGGHDAHILEHMREGYFVPSLVWNAMKAMGAAPIAYYFVEKAQQGEYIDSDDGRRVDGVVWPMVEKAIMRYCRQQLGIPY